MEVAEEKVRAIVYPQRIIMIQLFCLPERKLVDWYKSLGYSGENLSIFGLKNLKTYQMQKPLVT
jgi:hypothetical protein